MESKPLPRLPRVGSIIRVSEDDTRVARPTAFYAQPEITPGEFEEFVAKQLLESADSEVNDLSISLHEKIAGADGTYDFDTTVRYQFAGMSFLVLVEAKLHRNPIKRELVQVLHQKVQSVGAHKGLMVSTAPYQTGAVKFAKAHGIALVTVTEGRFVYETRDVLPVPQMSREEAADRFGLPAFVGHYYGPGDEPGFTQVWLLSPDRAEYPRRIAKLLLGRPSR
jgi:hypothetical protein